MNTKKRISKPKAKKQKPAYAGIEFDSAEEIEFFQWLEEAREYGLVKEWVYHPEPILLSPPQFYPEEVRMKTKSKTVQRSLLKKHTYQADFMLTMDPFGEDREQRFLMEQFPMAFRFSETCLIDVKGKVITKYRSPNDAIFSVNRKWMYAKYGLYVEKVVPEDLFKRTWLPEKAKYTAVKKEVKTKYKTGFISIERYLDERKKA